MNLIQQAVEPLRQAAIDSAEAYARRVVAQVEKELIAANNDLNTCAPYPTTYFNRADFSVKHSKYSMFRALTKSRTGVWSRKDPVYADMDVGSIEHFVKNAKEDAAASYEQYVSKLIGKIGEVTQAQLTSKNTASGENLWHFSVLKVAKVDGSIENWQTQMILNVSKLGKVFNQFPTRKVK